MSVAARARSCSGVVICRLISHAPIAPTIKINKPVNAITPRNRRAAASIHPVRISTHTTHGACLTTAQEPSRALPSAALYDKTDGPFEFTFGPGTIVTRLFHTPVV